MIAGVSKTIINNQCYTIDILSHKSNNISKSNPLRSLMVPHTIPGCVRLTKTSSFCSVSRINKRSAASASSLLIFCILWSPLTHSRILTSVSLCNQRLSRLSERCATGSIKCRNIFRRTSLKIRSNWGTISSLLEITWGRTSTTSSTICFNLSARTGTYSLSKRSWLEKPANSMRPSPSNLKNWLITVTNFCIHLNKISRNSMNL